MFEIEYVIAVFCILFFALVGLISNFNSLKATDKLAAMSDELEQKNQKIRSLEQQLYKYRFFKDVENNDKQSL